MFWIAVASLIMSMSGEGDDTRVYRMFMDAISASVTEVVTDHAKVEVALASLNETDEAFRAHRESLQVAGKCLEEADRTYTATVDTYEKCLSDRDARWELITRFIISLRHDLKEKLTEDEWNRVMDLTRRKLTPQ
jgi:hypothetical protein